jgi:hypothetical protein
MKKIIDQIVATGYKVNIQKSIVFLHTDKEKLKIEVKHTILKAFTLVPKSKIFRNKSKKVCARFI